MKKNFKVDCVVSGTEREREILSATAPTPAQKVWITIKKILSVSKNTLKFLTPIAKVFAGALLWTALGDLAPSLREATPHFYLLNDKVVGWWDTICSLLCRLFGLA